MTSFGSVYSFLRICCLWCLVVREANAVLFTEALSGAAIKSRVLHSVLVTSPQDTLSTANKIAQGPFTQALPLHSFQKPSFTSPKFAIYWDSDYSKPQQPI